MAFAAKITNQRHFAVYDLPQGLVTTVTEGGVHQGCQICLLEWGEVPANEAYE